MVSSVASHGKALQGDGPWDISDILKLPSAEEIIKVLGKSELQFAFDEYIKRHPSFTAIEARHYIAPVYGIITWPEPNLHKLLNSVKERPTSEPWDEALFCWRVKQHLESSKCTAVDWKVIEYYTLPTAAEQRDARTLNVERCGYILALLERLQKDRNRKAP
ncbi:hypothetical protein F4821DRAFT_63903 [Hypoxylon rubiginosum]|uniref:Uncharacterized protein n=1 Tax=Hypoxylon rubiginosum TaxID=110542 RepID=A0ACC0CIZ5_9PEZI|nr:hypothetical protein F4821DRAFT_63903 [Hypoxylon rubiginosum]